MHVHTVVLLLTIRSLYSQMLPVMVLRLFMFKNNRVMTSRYKPAQKPDGFICLTNPAQYRQKLYQNPEQPAVVTGEPVFNLMRYIKGQILQEKFCLARW